MGKVVKKGKKFKPCTKPRLLAGAVPFEVMKQDLAEYNKHRYKVFIAKSKTDHHPVEMNPFKFLNIKRMTHDAARLMQIDKENKELLRKINVINRLGGVVDTYNPVAYMAEVNFRKVEERMRGIELKNKEIYKAIMSVESVYNQDYLKKSWQRNLNRIKHTCRFPFKICERINLDLELKSKPSISENLDQIKINRPLYFLDFQLKDGALLGRVIVELYFDFVPVTVQNFMEICEGQGKLTYKNCLVHRIVPGQYLETGDITRGNGRGGFSIYGKWFSEENHKLKHTRAGVLSMVRVGDKGNNSQFCITFTEMERLNKKNVVFGKTIKGIDTIFKIQDYGRRIGKPYAEIIISNCGKFEKYNKFEFGSKKKCEIPDF